MSSLPTHLLATEFGSPNGVTSTDNNVHTLWHLTYYIGIPLAAIVVGGIAWSLLRYRRKPGDDVPAQFQYHIPIEAAYTIIPIILVAVIFGFIYGRENTIDHVSKTPAVKIRVDGFQWGWKFTYPNGHQEVGSISSQPNINSQLGLPILYMPAGETVQFQLVADDVNHGFYIPEFLMQRDMIPGINNVIDINVKKPHQLYGECNQLCGTYHSYMRFEVDVMSKADYNTWYAHQPAGSITQARSA